MMRSTRQMTRAIQDGTIPPNQGPRRIPCCYDAEGIFVQCTIRVRRHEHEMVNQKTIDQAKANTHQYCHGLTKGDRRHRFWNFRNSYENLHSCQDNRHKHEHCSEEGETLCETNFVGAVDGDVGKVSPSKSIYNIKSVETQLALFVAFIKMKLRCPDARLSRKVSYCSHVLSLATRLYLLAISGPREIELDCNGSGGSPRSSQKE